MGVEGCPVCNRGHENHLIWLMSDDPEFDKPYDPFLPTVESRRTPYPKVAAEPTKDQITGWNTPQGRVIKVTEEDVNMEREYENFEVVTGWDSTEHYGESVEYPTYTTLYKDLETGLLVIDKDDFEKWIRSLRGQS